MSLAFLVVTPGVVGALTVYGTRGSNLSIMAMIFNPWGTVFLMMIGCALTLLEGAICIALMTPLFLFCGSLGGLGMGLALRRASRFTGQLPCIALLPLLVLLGEQGVPSQDRFFELKQSIIIDAAPQTVWRQILSARDITADELPLSLTHLIGVPRPTEGVNVPAPDGSEVRYSKWERGVNFRARVTHKVEHQSISWNYVFDSDSFPPGSMDDHVTIGGKYFNLHDTTFNLQPMPGNRTRLDILTHYRVSTSVNFYAVPVATLLGNDFIATLLTFYKHRSEKSEASMKLQAKRQDAASPLQ